MCIIRNFERSNWSHSSSNNTLAHTTAVNMFANRPMVSVTAKPLMGPVPNLNMSAAATTVVRLESMMAEKALWKPAAIAACSLVDDAIGNCC